MDEAGEGEGQASPYAPGEAVLHADLGHDVGAELADRRLVKTALLLGVLSAFGLAPILAAGVQMWILDNAGWFVIGLILIWPQLMKRPRLAKWFGSAFWVCSLLGFPFLTLAGAAGLQALWSSQAADVFADPSYDLSEVPARPELAFCGFLLLLAQLALWLGLSVRGWLP